jgi:hypothetical protein
MKNLLVIVILWFVFLPIAASAQKWVEPYEERDGGKVEGHWQTPQDSWQKDYTKPGKFNPLTGKFNTYGNRIPGSSSNSETSGSNSNVIPGSNPDQNASNPYIIPGSRPSPNAPNTYAIPGSSPPKTTGVGR